MKLLIFALFSAFLIAAPKTAFSQSKGKSARDTATISDHSVSFRAVLPAGFVKPSSDSTLFSTEYGNVMMRATIAETKQGACMTGFYDFFSDYFADKSDADALDSLQMQLLRNMNGTLTRQYKMILNGKKARRSPTGERPMPDAPLQSRTTYFTTVIEKKTTYWRFVLMLDKPRIYQMAVTSTDRKLLDRPDVNAFFESVRIVAGEE